MTDSLFNVDELDPGSSSPPESQSSPPGDTASPPTTPQSQSLSLYRKYRPQSFASDELFGQQHIVNTLKNAIRLDRIGHAYLFCGPRGTGKTTTARILAKAVNCLDPDPGTRPCNVCDACTAINANATTDVIEIDAASNRGIDDIRELRERVKFAPTMLNTKFYIIDEAHQITGAAANAFLKTLEEPPAHTRFVLATTDPEELLPTIVSRCQRFDFRRIGLDAMTACLVKVAEAEQIDIEAEAITTIARHATGSLRDALGLLDQVAVYRDEKDADTAQVTNELVRSVLGISRNDRVEGLVRAIADGDPGAGLTIVNEAIEVGEDARQLGRQLISYLRLLMLERASSSPDADDTARELAQRFELARLSDVTRVFADVDYKSRHSSLPQLPLELAIVSATLHSESKSRPEAEAKVPQETMSSPQLPHDDAASAPLRRNGPSLQDRVRGASKAKGTATSTAPTEARPELESTATQSSEAPPVSDEHVAPAQDAGPADDAPDGNADLERIVELWDTIRMDVKALNRRTEALLQQADPIRVEGTHLTLVAAYPFHQKRLNDDDTRKTIEEVLERRSGARMTVSSISRDEAQQIRTQRASVAPNESSQAANHAATRGKEARSRDRGRPPVADSGDEDDSDPVYPETSRVSNTIHLDEPSVNGTTMAQDKEKSDLDEARIEAAINIFDAEIIEDEE